MKHQNAKNNVVQRVCLVTISLLLLPTTVLSLPEDSSQPIEIQANSAERDAKTGVTTYTGNVDIHQGSIHISASTVTLKTDDNDELSTVIANGGPARYEQDITGPDDKVKAQGNRINYKVQEDVMILEQNASLEQKGSRIQGERIEYDVKSERVKASAGQPGTSDNSKRISVTIPPSKNKASKKSTEATPDKGDIKP